MSKAPPKLDWKADTERVTVRAVEPEAPAMVITKHLSQVTVEIKLTAKRARQWARWLELYAGWVEKLKE